MYTECPHCATVYAIDAETVVRARGRVRCGACEREFDALAMLFDQADAPAAETGAVRLDSSTEARAAQGDLFAPATSQAPAPLFIDRHHRRSLPGHARWAVAGIALTLLLAAQMLLAQRAELATDPRWRPGYEIACRWLGCTLPVWRDPSALRLIAREIAPHPSVPDALLVTATLRNDGAYPQAWPLLELALSDLDGRPVALRRFHVNEYIGDDAPALLEPGQAASARLELRDPGKEALAFAFEFR